MFVSDAHTVLPFATLNSNPERGNRLFGSHGRLYVGRPLYGKMRAPPRKMDGTLALPQGALSKDILIQLFV